MIDMLWVQLLLSSSCVVLTSRIVFLEKRNLRHLIVDTSKIISFHVGTVESGLLQNFLPLFRCSERARLENKNFFVLAQIILFDFRPINAFFFLTKPQLWSWLRDFSDFYRRKRYLRKQTFTKPAFNLS